MLYDLDDTIIAPASARAGGIRGIVRLSGAHAFQSLEHFGIPFSEHFRTAFPGRDIQKTFPAFRFQDSFLLEKTCGIHAAFFCWPRGASYTGQNSVEIHTHGSLPLLEKIVTTFCKAPFVRLAQPGEFTLRAFLSGRLDLTQAEAVLGVINATDDAKLEVALTQLAGGLAGPLHALRENLFDLLGHLEAAFDFAEEDISFITPAEIDARLAAAAETLHRLAEQMESREKTETEIRVVLHGPPNIGKSSLFNALLGAENAVVYDAPGTTRDYLAARWTPENQKKSAVSCILVDTAGDGENGEFTPGDTLTDQAIHSARRQKHTADIQIFCIDARDASLGSCCRPGGGYQLTVLTRGDLLGDFSPEIQEMITTGKVILTSTRTGAGILELKSRLREMLEHFSTGESHVVAATAVRCRESVRIAAESLLRAKPLTATSFPELLASEIRTALDALGIIVGAIYTEDILDSIFSRFCVGK